MPPGCELKSGFGLVGTFTIWEFGASAGCDAPVNPGEGPFIGIVFVKIGLIGSDEVRTGWEGSARAGVGVAVSGVADDCGVAATCVLGVRLGGGD